MRRPARPVWIAPPFASNSAASASASLPAPPTGNGQPSAWALAEHHDPRRRAETLGKRQDRVGGGAGEQRACPSAAEAAGERPSPTDRAQPEAAMRNPVGGPQGMWNGASMCGMSTLQRSTSGPKICRYGVGVLRVEPCCGLARRRAAAGPPLPSSSGWPMGAGGSAQLSPCPLSSRCAARNGDVRPNGWIALHTSCTKPGSVS